MTVEGRGSRVEGASAMFRPGFTLVELLVVVGVISILMAVAVPSYQKVTYQARAAAIIDEFQTVRTALYQYYGDHGAWPEDEYRGRKPSELTSYLPGVEFRGQGYQLDYENWEGVIGISAIAADPRLEAALGSSIQSSDIRSYRLNNRYTFLIESGS